MDQWNIIKKLPYKEPFLFVDELIEISENHVIGCYQFKADEYFYQGHFRDNPITPGVILTEVMAQIGVVCLGIFLLEDVGRVPVGIAMTSSKMDFFLPVFPEQKVQVESKKVYFRFNKLKCSLIMKDSSGNLIARGEISGMVKAK